MSTELLAEPVTVVRRAVLHPNYIVRVAGEPVAQMALTETGATAALLRRCAELRQNIGGRTEAVCTILERLVPRLSETDRALSRRALDLKRAIHNLRSLPAASATMASLAALLEEPDRERIAALVAEIDALAALDAQIGDTYAEEIEETRHALRNMWQRSNLQHGLSYSNPDLFRDYTSLFEPTSSEKRWSEKKRRNLEDTLVQYAARCATKTSPMSSLTVVHVGRWDEGERPALDLEYRGQLDKRVAFKTGLFQQMMAGMLTTYPAMKQYLPLKVNPSLVVSDGKVRFRRVSPGNTLSGRTWGTGEAIAELNVSGIVQCVLHVFRHHTGPSMRSTELIGAVCGLAKQLEPVAVETFVQKLFDVGLLVPETELREQTDVLRWGETILGRIGGDHGEQCRAQLRELQEQLRVFPAAAAPVRAQLMGAMRGQVEALSGLLGAQVSPTMLTPMFFENCYLAGAQPALCPAAIEPFRKDLELLLGLAPAASYSQKLQVQFADYFLSIHGESGICRAPSDLLAGFDDIYGVARMGFVPDANAVAPPSAVYLRLLEAETALLDYLAPLMDSSEDVELDRVRLAEIVAMLPPELLERSVSHSFVGQMASGEGDGQFVLNQIFGGRSSLLSRFLEVSSDEEVGEVRDYLARTSDLGSYAELPAVFGFNANRHPRLADREVVVPGYAPHWDETEKLDLNESEMVFDRRLHKVWLRRRDGTLLDVWYQGFLLPALLPRMQRVLALIGTEGPVQFIIGTMMRRRAMSSDHITPMPRVTLGHVVLSRRMLVVPRTLFPSPDQPPLQFFLAVQEWRAQHNAPNEVFVRTSPITSMGGGESQLDGINWSEVSFKNMKPSYVKLDNPRLVRLLARALSRNTFPLILTEALPDLADQHVTVDGQKHVAELHLELTRPPLQDADAVKE